MVKDVKEGKMSELLFQDKEEGVKHVNELRNIEEPGHVQSPQSFRII